MTTIAGSTSWGIFEPSTPLISSQHQFERRREARRQGRLRRPDTPLPVIRSLTDIDNDREYDSEDPETAMDMEASGECDDYLDFEVRALTKQGRQSKRDASLTKERRAWARKEAGKMERLDKKARAGKVKKGDVEDR
ncbi:hypothetical protein P7C70_g1709, partial [Phenoliferia sp. Uapishka_3]